MSYSDTTLIIPTLNEEKNIGELLKIVTKMYKGMKVIVADDGSTDSTHNIVRSWHKKMKRVSLLNRAHASVNGLTASVVDGALQAKTKYFVVIDGDLQHPPEKIGAIVRKLRSGNDIVGGFRKSVANDWPFFRKLMSKVATWSGKLRLMVTGVYMRDIMSGFFGCDRALFIAEYRRRKRSFILGGYKVLFDLLKWMPKKIKVAEVAYVFGARLRGESKISSKHIIFYAKSLLT